MHYAMAIDIKKCIGCRACSIACKSNNNLPNGIWWNRVDTESGEDSLAVGTYPDNLQLDYTPISCQHCDAPACLSVCPVEAITKRGDGIVIQDNELCIGCQLCIAACPYNARVFNEEEPEYVVDFPLGDWDAPAHKAKTVEKCTFCVNRLDRGEKPACMELCLGRARFWGDLDDPDSEVSQYIAGKTTERLLEDKGTGPSCYYLR